MWHKGYNHYHTSFHYPLERRIGPERLAEDLKSLGASFAFCAGDHGDTDPSLPKTGKDYWGVDVRQFEDYRATCLSVSEESGVVLIPSPETPLMFPPFEEKHEHHTCVPILDYLPSLFPPRTPAAVFSYTDDADGFIADAHKHDVSLSLNHAYGSAVANSFFGGPPPLTVPALYRIDYLELLTNNPDWFPYDFDLYLKFLSHPVSSLMACCGAVDNCTTPFELLSSKTETVPATFLHLSEDLTGKSLIRAWNERRSYAVFGDLRLERMEPVPSKIPIEVAESPFLNLSVRSLSGKKITRLELYRNGTEIYRDNGSGKEGYDWSWKDDKPLSGKNHYLIHIGAEEEHLVTSPATYLFSS